MARARPSGGFRSRACPPRCGCARGAGRAAAGLLAAALLVAATPAWSAQVRFDGNLSITNFFGVPLFGITAVSTAEVNGVAATTATPPLTRLTLAPGIFSALAVGRIKNRSLMFEDATLELSAFTLRGPPRPIGFQPFAHDTFVFSSGGGCAPTGLPAGYLDCAGGGLAGFGGLRGTIVVRFESITPSATRRLARPFPAGPIGAGGYEVYSPFTSLVVLGAGWTTRTATVVNPSGMVTVEVHTPQSSDAPSVLTTTTTQTSMGSRNTGNAGLVSDRLSLVSPLSVVIIGGPPGSVIPAFARLEIEFLPEPAPLALHAGAVTALAALGWRRERARRRAG